LNPLKIFNWKAKARQVMIDKSECGYTSLEVRKEYIYIFYSKKEI
jgi:hypothetical protein